MNASVTTVAVITVKIVTAEKNLRTVKCAKIGDGGVLKIILCKE